MEEIEGSETIIDLPQTGFLFSFYDDKTSMLYLGVQGHTEILCYRFKDNSIKLIRRYSVKNPIHSISFKPSEDLDKSLGELAK